MAGKSFVKGALVLSVAGILAKCLGAVYRIPFGYIASEECLALYSMVYPIYNLLMALSTAGIPLALSKLVAEYEEKGKSGMSMRIMKLSLLMLSAIGIGVGVFIFINAEWLAVNVFPDERVAWSLRAIAPAMIFSCMQAVFRGYFQGLQQMVPTALSQITEQFVRVGVIFVALFALMPYGDAVVAAGASAGASVGGGVALLLMLTLFVRYRSKHPVVKASDDHALSNSQVLARVIALAIPISIGGLALPIMQSVDSLLVVPRLEVSGISHAGAMAWFGYLGGCVQPLLNLPFMLTTAIAASLVPNISEALAMGHKQKVSETFANAMQLAILIVLPATVGLMTLAYPIIEMLYPTKPDAGLPMFWSAAIVLMVGLYQISAGTLQGMGRAMVPMYSLLMGAAIKIALTYTLTAIPALGIRGAALASVIGFGVAACNNIVQVSRQIGWDWLSMKYHIVKPVISVVAMAVLVLASYAGIYMLLDSNGMATLISIVIGGSAYFAVLLAIGGVSLDIIRKMPKVGNKLAALLLKLKVVKE